MQKKLFLKTASNIGFWDLLIEVVEEKLYTYDKLYDMRKRQIGEPKLQTNKMYMEAIEESETYSGNGLLTWFDN